MANDNEPTQFSPLQFLHDEATKAQVSDHGRAMVAQLAQQVADQINKLQGLCQDYTLRIEELEGADKKKARARGKGKAARP
jgi:uncharacterized protein YciW